MILAAYEAWGERCPEKLLGDFAFVISDKRKQSLFCARDHFGVKPFYYYSSAKTFAFGSEVQALLCLPEVPRRLNEAKLADYLFHVFEDQAITYYQDILCLPAAHTLIVNGQGGRQLRRYWALDPSRELRLQSDEEYAEAFRDRFTRAGYRRLRNAFPVGKVLTPHGDAGSLPPSLIRDSGRP